MKECRDAKEELDLYGTSAWVYRRGTFQVPIQSLPRANNSTFDQFKAESGASAATFRFAPQLQDKDPYTHGWRCSNIMDLYPLPDTTLLLGCCHSERKYQVRCSGHASMFPTSDVARYDCPAFPTLRCWRVWSDTISRSNSENSYWAMFQSSCFSMH